MNAIVHPGLCVLALRRSLPAVLWGGALVLALWLARTGVVLPTEAGAMTAEHDDATRHALSRQASWAGMCLFLLPVLVLRAAGIVGRWRKGDLDWMGCRAISPAGLIASTWVGTTTAGLLLLAGVALTAELPLAAADTMRLVGRLPDLRPIVLEDERGEAWRLADPGARTPEGSRLRVRLTMVTGHVAGGGPSADVRLRATRAGPDGRIDWSDAQRVRESRQLIGTLSAIEVELPPGEGELVFEIARESGGSVAVLTSGGPELWAPGGSQRLASLDLLTRAAIALGSWLALAIGLGAWLSAPLTVFLLVSLWSSVWLGIGAPRWLPGGDLPSVLAVVGEGRLPRPLEPSMLATSLAAVALGLLLGAWNLRGGRRA